MTAAELSFAYGAGRTFLTRQNVRYPFHITKALHLDSASPALATVLLQSSSGGIYGGDELSLRITSGQDSHSYVTTQGSSIVHDAKGRPSSMTTKVSAAPRSVTVFVPKPAILFPGADFLSSTEIEISDDSEGLVLDAFLPHAVKKSDGVFSSCESTLRGVSDGGDVLFEDRQRVTGEEYLLGTNGLPVVFSAYCWGTNSDKIDYEELDREWAALGAVSGVTDLPNGAGRMVRAVCPDGTALDKVTHGLIGAFFERSLGFSPKRRFA